MPVSKRKLKANEQNAKESTGPKSEQGEVKASRSAGLPPVKGLVRQIRERIVETCLRHPHGQGDRPTKSVTEASGHIPRSARQDLTQRNDVETCLRHPNGRGDRPTSPNLLYRSIQSLDVQALWENPTAAGGRPVATPLAISLQALLPQPQSLRGCMCCTLCRRPLPSPEFR
jgi:hypothetical protein